MHATSPQLVLLPVLLPLQGLAVLPVLPQVAAAAMPSV
jgi:hypothetical protein